MKKMKNTEQKIEVLFNSLNIPVKFCSYIGAGVGSKLYKVVSKDKVYAIKVGQVPDRRKRLEKEYKMLKFLEKKNLDFAPKAYHLDKKIFKYYAVVMDYIEGEPPSFTEKQLAEIAKILATVNKLDQKIVEDGFSLYSKQELKPLEKNVKSIIRKKVNKPLVEGIKLAFEKIKKCIEDQKEYFGVGILALSHGDPSDNFLFNKKENKIYVVDWENYGYFDVAGELVWFCYTNKLPKIKRKFFYSQYKKYNPLAKDINFMRIQGAYEIIEPLNDICSGVQGLLSQSYKDNEKYYKSALQGIKKLSKYGVAKTVQNKLLKGLKQVEWR